MPLHNNVFVQLRADQNQRQNGREDNKEIPNTQYRLFSVRLGTRTGHQLGRASKERIVTG